MSDSKDIIVRVENLEKTYRTQIESLTILKNLNMSVTRGSKCVIVGRSGSGKSTLLNIIGGLDSATCGSVTVDGIQVASMAEEELTHYRQKVLGLVFQFHYLLKDFTALENVFLPCYMAGEKKKLAIEKAKSLLRDVGLEDRMNHLPSELSGGERQRVAVARCLVNDPELILADEPTGNLDPRNSEEVMEVLEAINMRGTTVVVATHDKDIVNEMQKRVVHLEHGVVVRDSEGDYDDYED